LGAAVKTKVHAPGEPVNVFRGKLPVGYGASGAQLDGAASANGESVPDADDQLEVRRLQMAHDPLCRIELNNLMRILGKRLLLVLASVWLSLRDPVKDPFRCKNGGPTEVLAPVRDCEPRIPELNRLKVLIGPRFSVADDDDGFHKMVLFFLLKMFAEALGRLLRGFGYSSQGIRDPALRVYAQA
jgi:hypothetical protein